MVCPVRDKLVANIAKSRAGPMSWRVAPLSPSIASSSAAIDAPVLRTSLVFELTTTVGRGRRQGDIARSVANQVNFMRTLINFLEGILLLHSL